MTATTGISIRALQRLFRKHRNATPMQVLANFRIAEAHAMILDRQVASVRHLAGKLPFLEPRAVQQTLPDNLFLHAV